MPSHTPAELHARARALRSFALRIEECRVHGLAALAGDDTWIGPTATQCRDELRAGVGRLHDVIATLRAGAHALDLHAASLQQQGTS